MTCTDIIGTHCTLYMLRSCLILCDPMNCSLPSSSVHGIFQARILEWVAIPFSRDLPDPRIEPSSALQADSFPLSHQGSLNVASNKSKFGSIQRWVMTYN